MQSADINSIGLAKLPLLPFNLFDVTDEKALFTLLVCHIVQMPEFLWLDNRDT